MSSSILDLQLVVEISSYVALRVQIAGASLSPKWIRSLCLCSVADRSQLRVFKTAWICLVQ